MREKKKRPDIMFKKVEPRLGFSLFFSHPCVIVGENDKAKAKAYLVMTHGDKNKELQNPKIYGRFIHQVNPSDPKAEYYKKYVNNSDSNKVVDLSSWNLSKEDIKQIKDFLSQNPHANKILK